MRALVDLISKLRGLDELIAEAIRQTIESNEAIILDMNTESQLYEKGIRRDGQKITPGYGPLTIQIKRVQGQPTNRVTLRDTGDFQEEFFIHYTPDGFEIKSGDWKAPMLKQHYGDEIMGLTDENYRDLAINYVLPEINRIIRDRL